MAHFYFKKLQFNVFCVERVREQTLWSNFFFTKDPLSSVNAKNSRVLRLREHFYKVAEFYVLDAGSIRKECDQMLE